MNRVHLLFVLRTAAVAQAYSTFSALILLAVVGIALSANGLLAQEATQRGAIKKVDADKGAVTIAVDGKDLDFILAANARVTDSGDKPIGLKHEGFKEGAKVVFRAGQKDGKAVLLGLKLSPGENRLSFIKQAPPRVDMSRVKPLTDMARDEEYKGHQGGLYPESKNERPAAHEAAGLALARQVQPLDKDGRPSADGKVVLLSIGMSNTMQASSGFERMLKGDQEINPKLVFVNGAQGGMTAGLIQNLEAGRTYQNGKHIKYWPYVDEQLSKAGLSRAQVQAVWLKQADAGPDQPFPLHAQVLQAELVKIIQIMQERYPNLKLVYISSRIYGGWAKTQLNPEPYAYEGGYSVKWLIEQQINGDPELNYNPKKGAVKANWLSWGPYLWANGTTKRADGFNYVEDDLREDDRTHESTQGQDKVGRELVKFFKDDTTSKSWFVRSR